MINFDGINPFSDSFLHLFFVTDPSVPEVEVRDIYKLEYQIFNYLLFAALRTRENHGDELLRLHGRHLHVHQRHY